MARIDNCESDRQCIITGFFADDGEGEGDDEGKGKDEGEGEGEDS